MWFRLLDLWDESLFFRLNLVIAVVGAAALIYSR